MEMDKIINAGFFKRLLAYVVDIVIVSLIVSIVTLGLSKTKTDSLNKQLLNVQNDFFAEKITMDEYLDMTTSLTYESERASLISNIVSVIILVGYFIGFQYLNNGQTLGKKLLKIKIMENNEKPRLMTIIIRSLLIDSILINLIGILLVLVLNDRNYVLTYGLFSMLHMLFMFVSICMMLFRNDKLGLHDIITHSSVVEV